MSGRIPSVAVQLVASQVHQMFLLQFILLTQQIHLPLASQSPRRQVRSARRRQL